MWAAIVEKILVRYLSPYEEGIEREKLTIGLLAGNVQLSDLSGRQAVSEVLDLTVEVVFGRIDKLTLTLNWSQWVSSKYSLSLAVDGLYLLVKPRKFATKSDEEVYRELLQGKLQQVASRENELAQRLKEEVEANMGKGDGSNDQQPGFWVRMLNNMIRNIQVKVSNIHFCFVDPQRSIVGGIMLDTGGIYNTEIPQGTQQDTSGTSANNQHQSITSEVESDPN
eukprot:Lankesteria_metandrocarpae@DN7678_c0_g1_i1.p1